MRGKYRLYQALYFIMTASFVVMLTYLALHDRVEGLAREKFDGAVDFSKGWHLDSGKEAEIKKLNKLEEVSPGKEFTIVNTLPDSIRKGYALCFRSKNIYYKVYIDGEPVCDPYVPKSRIYNRSFGTRWNYVELSEQDAGKQAEIRVTTVDQSSRAGIDMIYISSPLGAALQTVKEKLVGFITCIILLFVGVLLIVADIPINLQKEKNHELMYLGIFAVSIAVWCTSETNLLQFFVGDSRLLQLVSCYSLVLVPIPMVFYLDCAFGFRRKFIVPMICLGSFTEFLACMILHFTGIADFHDTLTLSHIMLAVSAAIMFYTIFTHYVIGNRSGSRIRNIYSVLRGLGLSGLSIATFIDLIRFYRGSISDSAMFVRIGLLIFVICYGVSSLERTISAVKLGVQSEFISQLAYRDGLTGIGNRTAFEERLAELEKTRDTMPAVGIIMFDVNDLKYVNDNMGHQMGDRLLVESAKLIREAFWELECACFRIGGDEFVVLVSGEAVKERCQQGIRQFHEKMEACNADKDQELPFAVSIACGFALYEGEKEGEETTLMDVYRQADVKMYENKKAIKAERGRVREGSAG